MSFAFKATAINGNDAIGTFNTYKYAANTNTATISATAPTQTVGSMNVNGIQIFARAQNTTSTTASPARVDIFIGKGLKSKQVDAYASLGKTTSLSYDRLVVNSTNENGTAIYYNENTGILTIEAATSVIPSTGRQVGADSSDNRVANGYFVFNASKSPSLVTIPNLQQRIAYLSDVKASGTAGGTSTTGYQTRTLNTLVDPTGIVTSLVSNQFILPAGTFEITASAPARQSDAHRIRLRNITDSSTTLLGSSELAGSGVVSQSNSIISGQITLSSPKTFEIQHQTNTGRATDGFGAAGSSGESEVFTQVKIIRIK
jgi:hypothetical protein